MIFKPFNNLFNKTTTPEAESISTLELQNELALAHKRIDLCVSRIEHLEHYNGLRYHDFDKQGKERLWDFNQSLTDLKKKSRPRSVEEIRRAEKNKATRMRAA